MPLKPKLQATTSTSKRSRSAEHPSSSSPPPSQARLAFPFNLAALPAFLRQSNADLTYKFDGLGRQQLARLVEAWSSQDPEHEWAQESADEVKLRNRWDDIRPWKKHRVHLKVPSDRLDYINASPILLKCARTGVERRYIATQGPKDNGFDHFWQMLWHETRDVAVVVMLTRFEENFRPKCSRYFPESEEDGSIEIETTDETGAAYQGSVKLVASTYHEASKSTIRELLLTCGATSKTVWHLSFQGWPDNGVPESEDQAAMIELVRLSRAKNTGWDHPRIIHCSAGVGRSGTFIALDHLLEAAERGVLDDVGNGDDPVLETVDLLRRQRMTMVQSETQFRILYDLVRQAYLTNLASRPPTIVVDDVEPATEKTPLAGGEPSPKARRLSRGFRSVFLSRNRKSMAEDQAGADSSDQGKIP